MKAKEPFVINIEEIEEKFGIKLDGLTYEEKLKKIDEWYEEYKKYVNGELPRNREERREKK